MLHSMRNLWSSFPERILQAAVDNAFAAFFGMVGSVLWAACGGAVIAAALTTIGTLRGVDRKWTGMALGALIAFALIAIAGIYKMVARRRRLHPRPLPQLVSQDNAFLKFPPHTSLGQLSGHWADMEHGWTLTSEAYQDLIETWNAAIQSILETHSKHSGRADRATLVEQVKKAAVDKLWRSARALKNRAHAFAHLMEYFEDV